MAAVNPGERSVVAVYLAPLFVAQVFGARPLRCFREVTLPNVWPAVLGALRLGVAED